MKKLIHVIFLTISIFPNLFSQGLTLTGALINERCEHQVQLMNNGNVISFGGDNGDLLSLQYYNSAEIYNSTTKTWSITASMNKKRAYFASVRLDNGNILAIGGEDDVNIHSSCEIFNGSSWAYTDSLLIARSDHAAIKLGNGKVLVAGSASLCEIYNPTTMQWSFTDTLNQIRNNLRLVLLNNGNVLAIGDDNTGEVYDTSTGMWTMVGNTMGVNRFLPGLALLDNGKVLITGGSATLTADLYDPITNMFSSTADLQGFRSDCQSIKINSKYVLIFGLGNLFSPFDTKCLEVYEVSTGTWFANKYSILGTYGYRLAQLNDGKVLFVGGSQTTGNGASKNCYLVDTVIVEPGSTTSVFNQKDISEVAVFYDRIGKEIIVDINSSETANIANSSFLLFDVKGSLLKREKLYTTNSRIDVSDLNMGVYIYKITRKGIGYSKKIIVK